MVKEYTVISTFAGCGGSSLGYKWAGFKELLAIDFDRNSVETFALNFPEVPIWQRDIKTVTAQEILDFCKLKTGELDVLDGSPPCQGFSTAGKRQVNDDRNDLFKEYVRLIEGLQPKVFIMENVSGMIKGKMKGKFIEIMTTLKSLNYNVKCKLMNAKYYNVPQSRERLIFIGIKNDFNIEPSFPIPNKKIITVKEAILQDRIAPTRHNYGKGFSDVTILDFNQPSFTLTKNIAGGQHIITSNNNTSIVNDQPAPKLTPLYLKYYQQAKSGAKVGTFNSNKKLNKNKVSFVLGKSEGNGGAYHPDEPRGLSTGERKRLSTFPDDFKFIDWKSAVERIGNSVPPKFMQAIAENIRDNILNKLELQ